MILMVKRNRTPGCIIEAKCEYIAVDRAHDEVTTKICQGYLSYHLCIIEDRALGTRKIYGVEYEVYCSCT